MICQDNQGSEVKRDMSNKRGEEKEKEREKRDTCITTRLFKSGKGYQDY